jgi:hypothetical protein
VDEVLSHRDEIPPGATIELKVFDDSPEARARKSGEGTGHEAATKPKTLRGRGMLAGILSSDEYLRRKREETALEDRSIR